MTVERYKQYILILDPKDEDDIVLIDYLEEKHGNKRKNSFSAILRAAVEGLIIEMNLKMEKSNGR
jgi:hypothetical protein